MKEINENGGLLQVIERFRGVSVLVVGDLMLDRYWFGRATRISPEAPVPVVLLGSESFVPGGAGNVAANLAGLGSGVYVAGVVGDDDPGRDLRSELKARSISAECVVTADDRQTITKTRVLVKNQQIARIDDENAAPLRGDIEDELLEKIGTAMPNVGAVVLSDYAKGCLTGSLVQAVISNARSLGKPVLVDPKGRDMTKYAGATILTPNLVEALNAAGIDGNDETMAPQAAERILSEVDLGALLITLGEHGMMLFEGPNEPAHFPSMARQVFDVTGAGDTVMAILSASIAAGASLHEGIRLANIGAGISVEKVGTSIVDPEEMRLFIEGHVSHSQETA
ncbi:MAG: D-glycero-beta-D-manno-heptose-7-phosphate kinase [Pyrinomonadaceae bacterium]